MMAAMMAVVFTMFSQVLYLEATAVMQRLQRQGRLSTGRREGLILWIFPVKIIMGNV